MPSSYTFYGALTVKWSDQLSCTVFDNGDWELFKGVFVLGSHLTLREVKSPERLSHREMQAIAMDKFARHIKGEPLNG